MLRKQLVALGHGAAFDRGAMEDLIAWHLAFQRDTDSMRHERDMVKAIVGRKGFKPGVTFEDAGLSEMDRPTLMVFGTADPTGTADIWRRVVGDLPHGELRLINDAGHTPWWDAPSEVAGHVQQFLGRPTWWRHPSRALSVGARRALTPSGRFGSLLTLRRNRHPLERLVRRVDG